jgi:putative polyhydroxyalkanoate system protein
MGATSYRPLQACDNARFGRRFGLGCSFGGTSPTNAAFVRLHGRNRMSKPLVVVIPHQLGRTEARRRLETGLGQLKHSFADKVTSIEEAWTGDRLDIRVGALGQSISGNLDVGEDQVRVELQLPWMLAMLAEKAKGLIEKQGTLLLERK